MKVAELLCLVCDFFAHDSSYKVLTSTCERLPLRS
jgi:hypothetical protein